MISLIIPTLNEEKYIRKTLQCLQEFRKNKIIEIIIVDGLSQDNTLALSRDLCDKVISVKPGRADQLNAGALKANNNLLLFIHADTIVNPENIYELLRKYEKIEWGYFHLGFRTRAFKFKLLSYCINLRSTLFKYATGDQCLFIKKKLFKLIFPGDFGETIKVKGSLPASWNASTLSSGKGTKLSEYNRIKVSSNFSCASHILFPVSHSCGP